MDLQTLCAKLKITAEARYGNRTANSGRADEWQRTAHPYTVTLRFARRRLTVEYWTGSAHTSEPTAADVLASLALDASAGEESFADFCRDLGYDPDSRKAERLHRACARIAPRLRRFLADHFDAIATAEH